MIRTLGNPVDLAALGMVNSCLVKCSGKAEILNEIGRAHAIEEDWPHLVSFREMHEVNSRCRERFGKRRAFEFLHHKVISIQQSCSTWTRRVTACKKDRENSMSLGCGLR